MSLLPYLFDDWGYSRPRYHHHHHYPSQLHSSILPLTPALLAEASYPLALNQDYYRPWRHLAAAARDVGSNIKVDKDKFQINLDVQHFKPEEISVKTVDGYIVVEGKHEEKKDDHGFISRQFTRRYALPEGTTPESVESKLSSDGVLSIIAPRKIPDAIKGERSVTITQTGPVRKEIKDQSEGTEKDEKKSE